MSRYTQRSDGDVIAPERIGPNLWAHKIECCDCGLVHVLRFTIVQHGKRRHIAFSAKRDNRATAQRRRVRRATGQEEGNG